MDSQINSPSDAVGCIVTVPPNSYDINAGSLEKNFTAINLGEDETSSESKPDENGNPPVGRRTMDTNTNFAPIESRSRSSTMNSNEIYYKTVSKKSTPIPSIARPTDTPQDRIIGHGGALGLSGRPVSFQIPIIGYEIMEERARFTIYKLRIEDPRTGLSWMVFRRYTDFVRLYSKLQSAHPSTVFPLPGKRRFKDNFDPLFLDERARGLQLFVNAVIKNLSTDIVVRDFFCLDEPPPTCDSEPESLALFGALEDTVNSLKNQIRQKDETIDYLKKKIMYFEDKMKSCEICNAGYVTTNTNFKRPGTSESSNYS